MNFLQKLLLEGEATNTGSMGGSWLMIVFWLVVIVLFGYFAMYRPEKSAKNKSRKCLTA